MSKRADNAVAAARRTHWVLIAVCLSLPWAASLTPASLTADALSEISFLERLRGSDSSSENDFLKTYADQMVPSIVPQSIRELLNNRGLLGRTFYLQWEEPPSIRELKANFFTNVQPGADPPASVIEQFIDALRTIPNLEQFSNNRDAYIGTDCSWPTRIDPFLIRHPLEGSDSWLSEQPYTETERVWANPGDAPLSQILKAWDLLQQAYVWYPVGDVHTGHLRLEPFSLDLRLPARLSGSKYGKCEDPAFELHGLLMPANIGENSLPPEIKDGQIFPGRLSVYGEIDLHPAMASRGAPWHDWYWIDRDGLRMTAPASVAVSFDSQVHVFDGQRLLLKFNSQLGRPPTFSFGNSATAFPNLDAYITQNPALLGDKVSSIRTRLQTENKLDATTQKIPILDIAMPARRVGAIGVFALLGIAFFFAIQLRNLFSVIGRGESSDEVWIGVDPHVVAFCVTVGSVTVLPLSAGAVLAWMACRELSDLSIVYISLWGLAVIPAYLIVTYFCARTLFRLRNELQSQRKGAPADSRSDGDRT